MRMKKSFIMAGGTLAVLAVGGVVYLLARTPNVSTSVQEPERKGVATEVQSAGNVANEDVLLIEGGTATSEHFMMVTNPPKK